MKPRRVIVTLEVEGDQAITALRRARDWRASVDGKVSWIDLAVVRVHVSAARPDRRPKADSGKEPKP